MSEPLALHFGYRRGSGHCLQDADGSRPTLRPPWSEGLMDTGLLQNGKVPDLPDGRVFWTCAGRPDLWLAFFWWDRSGDRRPNSNSGFYVRGFSHRDRRAAFDYACAQFPEVAARQRHPLSLQP
jgi:hypothetical protein